MRKTDKGIVLAVIIAVLAILSSLAVSFTRLTIINRGSTQNYEMLVIAKLNAYAGFDVALARMQATSLYPEMSADEIENDWLFKNGDSSQIGFDSSQIGFERQLAYAHVNAPVGEQSVPSFAIRESDNSLKTVGGYYLSGMVEHDSFNYALKITDSSSKININNPKFRLMHMLTTLFEEVFVSSLPTNGISWQEIAYKIVSHREALATSKFNDIKQLISNELLTFIEFKQVKNFITVHGWENPSTWQTPTDVFYRGDKPNYVEISQRNISGFVQQPRAPVNINTASKPVLVSVLSKLKGFSRAFDIPGFDPYKRVAITKKLVELPSFLAREIAEEIIIHRKEHPFKSWAEFPSTENSFNVFVDTLTIVGLTQAHKDLIKANANPNALMNRSIPNKERYFSVDKSDVITPTNIDFANGATVEFCFAPTGVFEIEVIGRLFHPATRNILAEHYLYSTAQLFFPVTHTTQRDFFSDAVMTNATLFPETTYHCNTSNLEDQEGNNVVRGGSTIDGYVQMSIDAEFPVERNFTMLFDDENFEDLWGATVAGNNKAAFLQEKVPITNSNSSDPLKSLSVFKGEFRTPEGSVSGNYGTTTLENPILNGQMVAHATQDLNLNEREGTLAMWIKFDNIEEGADESIVHISHVLDAGLRGLETSVFRYVNKLTNKNELHISRWIWEDPKNLLNVVQLDNLEIPLALWTRIVIRDIDELRQSKKWYRLVIGWENYTKIHAVFTHDGVDTNATSLFHYTTSLPNILFNNGLLTIHLDRTVSSNLDRLGNPLATSSFLAVGGYSFTPETTLPLLNQLDISFLLGIPAFRFSHTVIGKVEGYNICHIVNDGSDFYQKPYTRVELDNPGAIFEQKMTLDCGCGEMCSTPLVVSKAEYTMWNCGTTSSVELESQRIAPDYSLSLPIAGECGQNITYRVLLNSDDGETSPIFDDLTVYTVLAFPKIIEFFTR